jgi:hypothetical protein
MWRKLEFSTYEPMKVTANQVTGYGLDC